MKTKINLGNFFLFIFLVSSCTTVYKVRNNNYQLGSAYDKTMIKKRSFYEYSAGSVYYDCYYTKTVPYDLDSIVWQKVVIKPNKGYKYRFIGLKDKRLAYLVKDSKKRNNHFYLPTMIEDTIINEYFLPYILYSQTTHLNTCEISKSLPYNNPRFRYTYAKDTTILTTMGFVDCMINNVNIVRNSSFLNVYPFQMVIEKKTGIPLSIRYPFCQEMDSINYTMKYIESNVIYIKKCFLLNKRNLF